MDLGPPDLDVDGGLVLELVDHLFHQLEQVMLGQELNDNRLEGVGLLLRKFDPGFLLFSDLGQGPEEVGLLERVPLGLLLLRVY
jgi:hypothetical protein